MKRALLIAAGCLAIVVAAWGLWPSDDGQPSTPPAHLLEGAKAARSIVEQLNDAELAQARSDAGTGPVTGIVENEEGAPVAGAEVSAYEPARQAIDLAVCPVCGQSVFECPDPKTAHQVLELLRAGKAQPRLLATTTTGPDGTFTFDALPRDGLELIARHAGSSAHALVSQEEAEPVVLVLSAPAAAALKVVRLSFDFDVPGIPLPGAKVSAMSLDTYELVERVTDGSGLLRLNGLDEGNGVWLVIEAPGLLPYIGRIYTDVEDTELTLEPARALVVRTSIGGKSAEATVTVSDGHHAATVRTQGGAARFEGLHGESYEVTAATDAMIAPKQPIVLDLEVSTLELELRAAARLLVSVVDEAGESVVAADLNASSSQGDSHSATAAQGALGVLGPLAEGKVSLEVNSPGFMPWRRDVELHAGDNPLEVVVRKGVKLKGQVVDVDGKPVSEAIIEAPGPRGEDLMTFSSFTGEFELTVEEPGPLVLTASLSAVGRTTVTVSAPAEGLVIRLEPRARLQIFVHEGATPVTMASVLVTATTGEELEVDTLTGADGVATVSGLETGTYRVVVHGDGYLPHPEQQVSIVDGRTHPIDVALDTGLSVSGLVVDARGAPVPGVNVQTTPWTDAAVTDDDGRFTLVTLDPAIAYGLEASTEFLRAPKVTIKGAQPPLRLVLAARPLVTGRVVDAVTGSALTVFEVDAWSIEAADGRFSVPAEVDAAGRVVVIVTAAGHETLEWQGSLEASRDVGNLRLPKAKAVEGFVRDGRGNPVGGAVVSCDYTAEEVTTAADGSFRLVLTLFEPGSVVTARRGQLRGSAGVQLGRPIELTLRAATRVSGQVLDSSGRGLAGTVTMREASAEDDLQAEASGDGSFTINLAQGRWVFSSRASAAEQTFQISGATMKVVLGSPPGSCAVLMRTLVAPDELLLLPGDAAPSPQTPYEQLASIDGAVLLEPISGQRVIRASGFRCGSYTLVSRWAATQKLQRIDVRSGGLNELDLSPPIDAEAAASH